MNTPSPATLSFAALLLCVFSFAFGCGEDDDDSSSPADQKKMAVQGLDCKAERIEDDASFELGVGAQDGPPGWPATLPPTAVVAMTYLQLKEGEEALAVFQELNAPIGAELSAPAAGLMGISIRISSACGTARTMTVWESEDAMMKFVTGPAHIQAIRRVGEVSRGGSITSTWRAQEFKALSWETVTPKMAEHSGPVY